jgi:predicted nucleotidyltransferase component of viral defense system
VSATEVRRRLRRRADELGLDFQQALQYYAMERFLFRLSQSAWSERFIVKGAIMLRVWDAAVARPTRDIDFMGRIENTPEAVGAAVRECLAVEDVDDGLAFTKDIDVARAMVDDRYPGVRAKVRGDLAGARFTLRLDVGIDDAVVPAPGWVDYPPLLDEPAPRILAYAPATAVAEKFEALVSLGLANSRLKDFYDIWMLASRVEFDGQELAEALGATFGRRRTPMPVEPPVALTNEYVEQDTTARMWRTYRARLAASGIEAPTDLSVVVDVISAFLMPPARAVAAPEAFEKTWTAATGWA